MKNVQNNQRTIIIQCRKTFAYRYCFVAPFLYGSCVSFYFRALNPKADTDVMKGEGRGNMSKKVCSN